MLRIALAASVLSFGVSCASADVKPTMAEAAVRTTVIESGKASWYKMGHTTANGERYDPDGLTAAHPSLPFNTKVKVRDSNSGREVVVRINDRGPFHGGRVIDLSRGAARQIGLIDKGVTSVEIMAFAEAGS